MIVFNWILLIAVLQSGEGYPGRPLPLTKGTHVELDQFPSAFYAPAICDAEGNIYMRVAGAVSYRRAPVWKYSSHGRKLAAFQLPDAKDQAFHLGGYFPAADSFDEVTYDGTDTWVFHFKSDGSLEDKIRLSAPESLIPEDLFVFPRGNLLVRGYIQSGKRENEEFSAIFSSDGKLIKEFKHKDSDGKPLKKSEEPSQPDASFAGGPDGNAYVTRGNHVTVISPYGETIRSFDLLVPGQDFHAAKLEISGSILSMEYLRFDKKGIPEVRFRTYDLRGNLQYEYVPDETLRGGPLCFSENEGYLFYDGNGSQTYFVRAAIH
jgi:hypothetical protein